MIEDAWNHLVPRLEADLLARASGNMSAKDDDAWEDAASLIRFQARILARSRSLDRDSIDEIVQEVLLKLQSPKTLLRLKRAGSTTGYVTVIIRNAAIDRVRRQQKGAAEEVLLTEDFPMIKFEEESPEREQAAGLQLALQSLRADERALLELRFWESLSIAEISRRLGITYSATAVRLFRALRKLRERLGICA
jgi:RNA polymerase sigma-70 factor (ECF subfamily)